MNKRGLKLLDKWSLNCSYTWALFLRYLRLKYIKEAIRIFFFRKGNAVQNIYVLLLIFTAKSSIRIILELSDIPFSVRDVSNIRSLRVWLIIHTRSFGSRWQPFHFSGDKLPCGCDYFLQHPNAPSYGLLYHTRWEMNGALMAAGV